MSTAALIRGNTRSTFLVDIVQTTTRACKRMLCVIVVCSLSPYLNHSFLLAMKQHTEEQQAMIMSTFGYFATEKQEKRYYIE